MRTLRTVVGASVFAALMPAGAAAQTATAPDVCMRFEDRWNLPERAAWTDICRTGTTLVSAVKSGDDLSKLPPAERDKLTLDATFIEAVLNKSPYREQVRAKGILVKGAIITKPLRLNDLVVEGSLSFLDCEFAEVVDLRRSRFSLSVRFTGSVLAGGLEVAEAIMDGSLVLGATEERQPKALPTVPTIGFIHAQGARVAGNLNIRGANIAMPQTAGSVDDPNRRPIIDLTTVRTGGSINIMRVKGHEIIVAASEVHGQLLVVDCVLEPTPQEKQEKSALYALVNLNFVRVTQDVFLNRTTAMDRVDVQGAEIGGGLVLVGGRFGSLIARGVTMKGALRIGYNQRPANDGKTTDWASAASLDLTNANIGVVSTQSSLDYWPKSMALTNARIGGFDFSSENPAGRTSEERADWFKKWLGRQDAILPYYHVRTVLAAAGDDATAAEVGYAGRDRELIESLKKFDLLNVLYLFFSKILIGYGYWMWLPLLWTAAFITAGTIVFTRSVEGKKERKLRYDALVYSVDMFLPVIEFRKRHHEIDMTSNARFYFYVHKLAGWVISSFIVAGLAGFTK